MWLLVGGDSAIGSATRRLLQARGEQVAATTRRPQQVAPDRPFLDLAAPLDRWEPPPATRAACVFAANARIASCQDDPAGSATINVTQTLALIDRLIDRGVHVLFLSTNQVFDGSVPNVPATAPFCPVSEYGRQKAQTEATLLRHQDRGAPVAILRLAKVIPPRMPLLNGWVEALSSGQPIRAFDDMQVAPIPIALVATTIARLLQDRAAGVFQLSGPHDVTYADVARFLAARLDANPDLVTAVSARASMPDGATPHHTTLDSRLLRDRYGLSVPGAWDVFVEILAAGAPSAGPQAG